MQRQAGAQGDRDLSAREQAIIDFANAKLASPRKRTPLGGKRKRKPES
jgi:hypothetical protein